jgi:hypothetical protein
MSLLLGPMAPKVFFRDHFQKTLVYIPANHANRFADIFGLSDFHHILNYGHLTYPRVRVTDNKNTIHKYDIIEDVDRYFNNKNDDIDRDKLMLAIAKGGTVVIDKIYELIPALDTFIDGLSRETGIRFSANGYFTPSETLGVNPHFDRHDVFAVQIHGSKVWYYREDHHILSQPMRKQAVPTFDDAWNEVTLHPGDVLYVPRGLWHCTRTDNVNSLHIAVGCYPLTVSDWLTRITREVPEVAELMESYVHQGTVGTEEPWQQQISKLTIILNELVKKRAYCDMPRPPRTLLELD